MYARRYGVFPKDPGDAPDDSTRSRKTTAFQVEEPHCSRSIAHRDRGAQPVKERVTAGRQAT